MVPEAATIPLSQILRKHILNALYILATVKFSFTIMILPGRITEVLQTLGLSWGSCIHR